jgi:hypothetical protein
MGNLDKIRDIGISPIFNLIEIGSIFLHPYIEMQFSHAELCPFLPWNSE